MASPCRDPERMEKIIDALEIRLDREMRGRRTILQIVIAIPGALIAIFLGRTVGVS